jgi:chromosome segregation ATPase
MKYSKVTVMVAAVAMIASQAFARTDIPAKIQQLKDNSENSKVNLKQYEDNLKTVNANLAEADKALKQLDRQKLALTRQTGETAKGKQGVDVAKKQLEGYMKTEQMKLEQEKQQMDAIKKTLAQLEENAKMREANIAQYQEKMTKVDTELAAWSERNQSIVELEQAIKAKEDEAKTDQKHLSEKKVSYEEEISKWRKQVRVSSRQFENFSKLKD